MSLEIVNEKKGTKQAAIKNTTQTLRQPTKKRPLEKLYRFRNKDKIIVFLKKYQFLPAILQEAYCKIISYFPTTQLFLEIVSNPEAVNDEQLVLSISTNMEPFEAIEKLEKFDEEWWLDRIDKANGKLCINLEYA